MDTPPTLPSLEVPASTSQSVAAAATAPWRRLRRFVAAERLSHWLYALFFLVAFVSGLLMWIPVTRAWLAGARYTVSQYHGYVGAAMIVVPLLLFVLLDRRRLGRDLREIDTWNGDDRRWFRLALRGYTLRGRQMPPQGRFNAGQKVNVVLVAAMAIGLRRHRGHPDAQAGHASPGWYPGLSGCTPSWRSAPWPCSPDTWPTCSSPSTAAPTWPGWSRGWMPEELARERHRRWWEEETGTREEAASGDEAGGGDGV